MGFSKDLTVNGTSNLLALLRAAGFPGDAMCIHDGSLLQNLDAAVDCYLHQTPSNSNLPGVKQVETLTITGTIVLAANAVITVTASGLVGSPVAVNAAMTVGMSNNDKAIAIATALNSNAAIRDFCDISVVGNVVTLTKKIVAANDATFNAVITDPNSTGITTVANSTDATAGALYTTTNGTPFGPALGASAVFELPKGADLSTIWLHTASSVIVVASIRN